MIDICIGRRLYVCPYPEWYFFLPVSLENRESLFSAIASASAQPGSRNESRHNLGRRTGRATVQKWPCRGQWSRARLTKPPGPKAGARRSTPGGLGAGPPLASRVEPPEPEPGGRRRSLLFESRAPRWVGGAGRPPSWVRCCARCCWSCCCCFCYRRLRLGRSPLESACLWALKSGHFSDLKLKTSPTTRPFY